ncbi:MAG TPA: glycosyl hydrolase family 39, partial [Acidobacteriaceae bacterium]
MLNSPISKLAAFACLAVSLGCAGAQTTRTVTVDVQAVAGQHSSVPLMVVGAGRANEGLRADWQQQLATVQREIGFRYLRFHGLLSDDMGVYSETPEGRPLYNFQYIDALYDAMLALHIRPFVEISFMPAKLASGDKTVFWWKGNITPPKDMEKWNGLIHALMEHWMERYGREEVQQWFFEVWNEPDLPIFWSGTQTQYFELYRNTALTIRAVCGSCRVGGPASAYFRWEQPWLEFVAKEHLPADFLSTHTYAVKTGAVDV